MLFTGKDVRRELPALISLAVPLIAGELGWVSMSLVDTVMLGRLPNSALAMASAALAQVLFNTLCFGMGGVLLGLDTLMSQAIGAREQTQANRWLLHGLVMAVALSLVLIALFGFGPALMRLMPVDRAILDGAIPAMQGLSYGTLPLMLYFALRRYLQANNHGRPIAFALISANIVNAAVDWLLIFGHRWVVAGHVIAVPAYGVVGSSWSTSFARLYLMAVMLVAVWWLDRRHSYGLRKVSRAIELQHLRKLFLLGAPAGASIFVEIGIFALVTSLIASFGRLPLAGHEVALQCASTSFMVPFAISSATSVRVGHAVGRMRTGAATVANAAAAATVANAAAAGWSGIGAGAGTMLIAACFFLTIPAHIARLFTPNAQVIAAAAPLLLIAAGFQFFDGIQITCTGALRGAGNTTTGLWTQLVCYWVVGMPIGAYFGFRLHMGAAGLWWGLLIALGGAALVLLWSWQRTLSRLAPRTV